MAHVLLRHRDIEDLHKLDVYRRNGGYDGLKKALGMTRAEVIDVVKASNLRGRGGAGFPTCLLYTSSLERSSQWELSKSWAIWGW